MLISSTGPAHAAAFESVANNGLGGGFHGPLETINPQA